MRQEVRDVLEVWQTVRWLLVVVWWVRWFGSDGKVGHVGSAGNIIRWDGQMNCKLSKVWGEHVASS